MEGISIPGLLKAALRCPLGKVVVDICYQCALTLVAATAPHRARPEADRDLADGIAAAAVQTLHRHNHSGAALLEGPHAALGTAPLR
jgi:hypothetical protein